MGESDGEPRQHIDPCKQIADYRSAVDAVSYLEEFHADLDAERIGIWGISYSGGHVLAVTGVQPSHLGRGQFADRPGAVLHCTFDEIPGLHASAGHVIADEVLLSLARRISRVLRKSDAVGRVGANRFVMIVPEITTDGADRLAERVERVATAPVSVRGQTYVQHTKVTVVPLSDQHAVHELEAIFEAGN
jgi:diguanylate cyclase (GGDEF)-like protein